VITLMLAGVAGIAVMSGLTSCAPPPSGPPALAVGCYDGVDPGVGDVRYDGPIDTLDNAAYGDTTDGTCQNAFGFQVPLSIIYAWDTTQASSKCASLDPTYVAFHMGAQYGTPTGYYYCYTP
jgi:hypothetical protein